MTTPTFFSTPEDFRTWLEENHDNVKELWVGFYRVSTGKPSITWPESVDEALCFGWIDGLRKSVDNTAYMIRFTPRKPRSVWSAVNIKRVGELTELGRMRPEGLKLFEMRKDEHGYSYEARNDAKLSDAEEAELKANAKAWEFFQKQALSYQKGAYWWIISAKQEATRKKRLAELIRDSEAGKKVKHLSYTKKI